MTDIARAASYADTTQREVNVTSGMLQHNDAYRERAQGRQAEARRWAEVDRLSRLSKANRPRRSTRPHHDHHHHSMRTRLRALRMHLHAMHSPFHLRPHH